MVVHFERNSWYTLSEISNGKDNNNQINLPEKLSPKIVKRISNDVNIAPIIEVRNLTVSVNKSRNILKRRDVHLINDVSFILNKSQNLGIYGESGSGKSTILKVITGVFKYQNPDSKISGDILYYPSSNECVSIFNKKHKFNQDIQIIFQNPEASFVPHQTIGHQLFDIIKLQNRVHSNYSNLKMLLSLINNVKCNRQILSSYSRNISGGESQRIAIARALAFNPKIIMFDETFSMMDKKLKYDIYLLLSNIQSSKDLTYIIVSHDHTPLIELCSQFIQVSNGRAEQIDKPSIPIYPKIN